MISMMGHQPKVQKRLFYTKFNLDRRIRKDHILCKIDKQISFEFIDDQVKDTYGSKGNVSVPPPVILKMMLLLILYNVRSERELMATISCPAGKRLKHRRFSRQRQQYEYYMPKKMCSGCRLREQCTRSSLRDIKTRQHLMERSFARATRYGLHRARWRRLWRVQIQEYLTASIQNLMVLLRHIKDPSAALSRRVYRPCIDNLFINFNARVFTMSKALAYADQPPHPHRLQPSG